MRSLKAIAVGCLFIFVAVLLIQLAYVFIAVGYNALAKSYPYLNEVSGYFRYFVGIPVFATVMFAGGYITASLAQQRVLLHCLVVAVLVAAGTLFPAIREGEQLSTTGVVVVILILTATVSGGLYQKKHS